MEFPILIKHQEKESVYSNRIFANSFFFKMENQMTENSEIKKYNNKVWNELLEPVESVLNELQTTTESQFMSIGKDMGLFSQQASSISRDSLAVINLIAGKENLQTVAGISKKIRGIERYISYSITQLAEDIGVLKKQKADFLHLNNPMGYLKKTISQLKTLSLSIKIENTRLTNDSSEFEIIAEEVKNLSLNSRKKIEDIETTSESAVGIIDNLLLSIDDLTNKKYKSMKELLDIVHNNISKLQEQNKQAVAISEEISGRLQENYNSINEIIMNLQFHDIVRQKIEHVIQSIKELTIDINECKISEQTNPGEFALKVYAFCQLQTEQLKFARKEVLDAIDKIKNMFNNVQQSIYVTINKIDEMSKTSSKNLNALIQQTGNNVGKISTSLYETIDSSNKSFSSAKLVVKVLDTISGYIIDLNTIGQDISLISFNGIIQAAHLGADGLVLSAIISEIQNFVSETQYNLNAISEHLGGIDTSTEKIKMSVDNEDDLGDSQGEVGKITNDLTTFFRSLGDNSDKLNNDLVALDTQSRDFSQKIEVSVNEITVGDEFGFGLSNAIDGLNKIVEKVQGIYGEIDQSAVKEILEEHRNKYTMNKEREIHDVFAEGDAELLPCESEIGNNVELF